MSNYPKKKGISMLIILGTVTFALYTLVFSNQYSVTEYYTKANWYNWEKFLTSTNLSNEKKITLIKQSILQLKDKTVIDKYNMFQNKIKNKLKNLSPELSQKQQLENLTHFIINQSSEVKKNIIKLLQVSDSSALVEKRSTFAALPYALLSVFTAFIFSFAHGAFTGKFWTVLGIEGIKKTESTQGAK